VPAAALREIFDANRSVGHLALEAKRDGDVTRRVRVAEDGPLRVRFPGTGGGNLEAMIVNTAGGIAGGDRHDLDVIAGEGARLAVTTAAAEKVYRSLGADSEIHVTLQVARAAELGWFPQETILFDRSRLSRRIEIDIAEGGSLVLAEAVVFGRSAMGEIVRSGWLRDRWRVRCGGKLVFAETLLLDGLIADKLGESSIGAGSVAIGTVLALPGSDAAVQRVREGSYSGEVAVSAWNGLAVARLCAKDSAVLRADIATTVAALGGKLPRLWLN
jgi:urease accessory protein